MLAPRCFAFICPTFHPRYTVSSSDPITGGGHCALGGGPYDFLVTSTLASQGPPAVGRALGGALSHAMLPRELRAETALFPKNLVSLVSAGDGSVNNAHFISALNMAEYAKHRQYRCPVVFAVTNNDICISLKGHGWIHKFMKRWGSMPLHTADGNDLAGVYEATNKAVSYSRSNASPSLLFINNLPRRFGHAATDRQAAYYTTEEIDSVLQRNPLGHACGSAVAEGITTYGELRDMFEGIRHKATCAFTASVALDDRIDNRQMLLDRNSAPLVPFTQPAPAATKAAKAKKAAKVDVMRKHMTGVFKEALDAYPELVYIGEDVEHGGYYLVTDGLKDAYPLRVRDWPPDETTLIGAGMGMSQAGLLPVVEIPYSKYLDCGADMFFEAVISNWLSNGAQPNGMVIRLQGFDKGVFGGNFHTHNSLYTPPGLDVVAYSNGEDYVRGMRYCLAQAKVGRVIMSVDSTALLNQRHLHDKDDAWRKPYPALGGEGGLSAGAEDVDSYLTFDDVIVYPSGGGASGTTVRGGDVAAAAAVQGDVAIVSYGNGVVSALQAAKTLLEVHGMDNVMVIDSPYLSSPPQALVDTLSGFSSSVFVDVCKEGQNPLSGFVTTLQNQGAMTKDWRFVSAARTYNPLGNTVTFVNEEDVVDAALNVAAA